MIVGPMIAELIAVEPMTVGLMIVGLMIVEPTIAGLIVVGLVTIVPLRRPQHLDTCNLKIWPISRSQTDIVSMSW
jgi:hypothetical protein